MITIDIVDDNNERSAKTVVQSIPVVSSGRNDGFDAAYHSARSYYSDLLHLAADERRASHANTSARRDWAFTLGRIARALSAWL